MGNATWHGKVYAADELHRQISLERDNGVRFIVQPELWDWAEAMRWVEEGVTLVATGLEAAGLPLLMRATVTEIEPFPARAPSALDTARAALERIANESDLRMSAYLNSDDMLRDYIGKVVRMKRIAADALAGLEGGEQP